MKWMTRQLTLPILIGFSLTGVSVALLYLLYKEDEDNARSPRRTEVERSRQNVIEYQVPRQFVPAVIGRGGRTVKDIQDKTETSIRFKEDNIECPVRVCVIRGSSEGTRLAEEMIKTIIADQPIIETYEMYVPQYACGRIIGRRGETIHQIQLTTGTKVIVESSHSSYEPDAQRRIIIKGTAEQIATALTEIEDKVREEKLERSKLEASAASRLPRGKLSPRNTAVNTDNEKGQSAKSAPVQIENGGMEVYVSGMESTSQFWVQVVGPGTTTLDSLECKMNAYYEEDSSRKLHALKNIALDQMVAAKVHDDRWYRAKVIALPKDGECEVYPVDYGQCQSVPVTDMLELKTDFLVLRWQAIECCLANVKWRESHWSHEYFDIFEVGQRVPLVAHVRGYKERTGRSGREDSPIICVDLYAKGDDGKYDVNIAEVLIKEGLAETEDDPLPAVTLSPSPISTPASVASPNTSNAQSKSNLEEETPSTSDETVIIEQSCPTSVIEENELASKFDSSLEICEITERPKITNIDLVTPQKPNRQIEQIDLVSPVKDETGRFINNEKKVYQNGSGDRLRNGSRNSDGKSRNSEFKIDAGSRYAPAGYESDLSDDSDEFELG